jgi:Clostripain family
MPKRLTGHLGRLSFLVVMLATLANAQRATNQPASPCPVDWPTKSASCPGQITSSATQQFKVSGLNDIAMDFYTGAYPQYVLSAKGTPASQVAPTDFLGLFLAQQSSANQAVSKAIARAGASPAPCRYGDKISQDLAMVRGSKLGIAPIKNGRAATLSESIEDGQNAVASPGPLQDLYQAYSDSACADALSAYKSDPILQWLARLVSGDHSVTFNENLNPNTNYKLELVETWDGRRIPGADMTWRCGEADIFSLSVGPVVTTLPYRTYSSQTVPVSPGSTTTQNTLAVNESTNVLGTALLSYHLPHIPGIPDWTGLAASVGPVYAFGSAPSVSKLGLFVGASVHLYKSFFVTPGAHIGQFADYPAGFTRGSVIPSGFGTLTPTTRNTVRFAIGFTFKTNTLKSSSQGAAPANNGTQTGQPGSQTVPAVPAPQPAAQPQPEPGQQPAPEQPVSQPQSENGAPRPSTAEWTVMVYMNGKNNLEGAALANFQQMAQIASNDQVNIVAELGRPVTSHSGTAGNWGGVMRFYVGKPNMQPLPTAAINPDDPAVRNADMGSAKTLDDFVSWAKGNYRAKKYLLIIWNHGQGWRLELQYANALAMRTSAPKNNRAALNQLIATSNSGQSPSSKAPNQSLLGGYRSVSFDEDTGNFLYNRDIEDVLQRNPVDIIGFDACLMSMVESAYAFRNVAHVFVGSEELVPNEGWPYDSWLSTLEATPGMDPKTLGITLVDSYGAHYGNSGNATLSAIDLTQISPLVTALSSFATVAKAKFQSERPNLERSRTQLLNFGDWYSESWTICADANVIRFHGIDLAAFLNNLQSETQDPELSLSVSNVRKALQPVILKRYASSASNAPSFGSQGLAIYFPGSQKDYTCDPDHSGYDKQAIAKGDVKAPPEFVQDTAWADFLQAYLKTHPGGPLDK